MTVPTLSPTPEGHTASGVGVSAEPATTTRTRHAASGQTASALDRASRGELGEYARWLRHTAGAGGCSRPVRLTGNLHTVDRSTGEVLRSVDTATMPDGVIYTACGNRRAAVCPACAETYRADTYQLIRAGIVGNPAKNIPASVAGHPCVFLTLTAPSFGPVHSRRLRNGRALPCRPSRRPKVCRHGLDLRCTRVHAEGDHRLGTPLCADCYDHPHQVVWNAYASELWRRFTIRLNRLLTAAANGQTVRVSYAKVAEFQRRGVAHYHALIRLDGVDPDDRDAIIPPPPGLGPDQLADAARLAALDVSYVTDPHPAAPGGWRLEFGDQVDARPVAAPGTDAITPEQVAGYLAKYATKATETTGHLSTRLTPDTIELYADDTHTGRLIDTAWTLGTPTGLRIPEQAEEWKAGHGRLRRWAHQFGFNGHFATKSRRYSTTYGVERERRRAWRRHHPSAGPAITAVDHHHEETTLIVGALTYAGTGWRTPGDALLATSAAARAREYRRTAREATASTTP